MSVSNAASGSRTEPGLGVAPTSAPRLARGDSIGRYVIVDRIGEGGMGVVYGAYDPELDRKVALKLLRATARSQTRRARLVREAQTLAQLSHPNVVAVHDVGTVDDQVYLAMEFVEGHTLTDWLEVNAPTWREIVAVFRAAGEGLKAAHDKGFVHRDFKPDNVMVTDPGPNDPGGARRVRVMDFGLVRATDSRRSDSLSVDASEPEGSDEEAVAGLTRAGAMVGTPAYMAPEQFRREPADARSDQFSFCVALYEALYGASPFEPGTVKEYAAAVLSNRRAPIPRRTEVPAWVRRVVERGLAGEPEDRWGSMRELLSRLDADPTRRNRWWGLSAALLVGIGLIGGTRYVEHQRARAACDDAGAAIDAVWNDARREELSRAFEGSGWSGADDTFQRFAARLDDWTGRWRASRAQACVAVLDGELPEAGVTTCFDDRRVALSGMLDVVGEGRREDVYSSLLIAAGLPSVEYCLDAVALGRQIPLPADVHRREQVQALRGRFARVRALAASGREHTAYVVAEQALTEAAEVDWPPLLAEAHLTVGFAKKLEGDFHGAREHLSEAYVEAKRLGLSRTAVNAAAELVFVWGFGLHDAAQADLWHDLARIDLSPEDTDLAATLGSEWAFALWGRGAFEESESHFRDLIRGHEQREGADFTRVARLRVTLGGVLGAQGKNAEAEQENRKAVEQFREALGPDNPRVLVTEGNLGETIRAQGRPAEGEPLVTRAVRGLTAAYGPDHVLTQAARGELAAIHRDLGRWEDALMLDRRNVESRARTHGPDHMLVAQARHNLAYDLRRLERFDEAEREHRANLEVLRRTLDPKHPMLATATSELGSLLLEMDRPTEARPLLEEAWTIFEAKPDTPGQHRAETAFALARSLWDDPAQRERARQLATFAVETYAQTGAADRDALAEARAWLAAHPG